ncbi:hypothetical protein LX36DRAFT_24103 [Colletotrichum falcatum]|nr:hypothetical protein LX36DRAFT_24103 [Colletotrichum falcatum]
MTNDNQRLSRPFVRSANVGIRPSPSILLPFPCLFLWRLTTGSLLGSALYFPSCGRQGCAIGQLRPYDASAHVTPKSRFEAVGRVRYPTSSALLRPVIRPRTTALPTYFSPASPTIWHVTPTLRTRPDWGRVNQDCCRDRPFLRQPAGLRARRATSGEDGGSKMRAPLLAGSQG